MAYVETRSDGLFRGRYRDKAGRKCDAGSYQTKAAAIAAAEALEGTRASQSKSMPLRDFFLYTWPRHTDVGERTQEDYLRVFVRHIDPHLGGRAVSSIQRFEVRVMLRALMADGMKPITAVKVKAVLGSAYKTLLDLDLVETNPTHGISIKGSDPKPFDLVEPDVFRKISLSLPNEEARLFATLLVTSGMRFGEAAELRVEDVNVRTNEVYVRRRMVRLTAHSGSEQRYNVEPGTKGGRNRVVSLSPDVTSQIKAHTRKHGLQDGDLLFSNALVIQPGPSIAPTRGEIVIPDDLGTFEYEGKTFQHGKTYAYVTGKCRCEPCTASMALYRRQRRAQVRKAPVTTSKRAVNVSGHLPHEAWRRMWVKACEDSGIGWLPRTHDLRHAHATLLVEQGVDIYEVKERLGHASVTTTEGYKHVTNRRQSKAANTADAFLAG